MYRIFPVCISLISGLMAPLPTVPEKRPWVPCCCPHLCCSRGFDAAGIGLGNHVGKTWDGSRRDSLAANYRCPCCFSTSGSWRWYSLKQELLFLFWEALLHGRQQILYWAPFLVCFYVKNLLKLEMTLYHCHPVQRSPGVLRVRDCWYHTRISNIFFILQAWNVAKINNYISKIRIFSDTSLLDQSVPRDYAEPEVGTLSLTGDFSLVIFSLFDF